MSLELNLPKHFNAAARKKGQKACEFTINNPSCDIEKYQKIACQDPMCAYRFARDVPGADISYCQERTGSEWSCWFAINIPDADIEYCYKNSTGEWGENTERFILR